MDVHGLAIAPHVKEVEAALQFVLDAKPAPDSVLLLVCGDQPQGALDEASAAWKVFQDGAKGLMKAQAISRLGGFKRVVARLVARELYFAATEDAAKEWLVRQ